MCRRSCFAVPRIRSEREVALHKGSGRINDMQVVPVRITVEPQDNWWLRERLEKERT